jgi:hypothetical protein
MRAGVFLRRRPSMVESCTAVDALRKHHSTTGRFGHVEWCHNGRHGNQEQMACIHAHVVHDRQPNTRHGSPCGILEWKEYVDSRPCSTWLTACHQQERSM